MKTLKTVGTWIIQTSIIVGIILFLSIIEAYLQTHP